MLEDDWIDKNEDILAKLLARLQDAAFRICTNARDVNVGDLIVVDLDENKFARGKIMKLIPGTLSEFYLSCNLRFKLLLIFKCSAFDVYLTDYGFVKNVDQCDLRILTDNKMYRTIFNLPARCFECTLTELLPSSFKSPKGKWIPEAIEWLKIFTENQIADLYIYSVVDDVASVRVLVGEQNINAKLLELGYAQHADESYLSKLNFELRDEKQKLRCKFEPEVEFADKIDKSKTELITQAPDRMCYKTIRLHGPFTPLETSIRGITRASSQKTQIVVDSASVNSVVMESNPQASISK